MKIVVVVVEYQPWPLISTPATSLLQGNARTRVDDAHVSSLHRLLVQIHRIHVVRPLSCEERSDEQRLLVIALCSNKVVASLLI